MTQDGLRCRYNQSTANKGLEFLVFFSLWSVALCKTGEPGLPDYFTHSRGWGKKRWILAKGYCI